MAVAAGAAREVELVMSPAAIVRGRVVQRGAPVAGARIAIAGGDAEVARSQGDGRFVLDRVPIGEVRWAAAPYRVRSPERSTIVAGDHNDVTLEIEALGSVAGVVRRHGQAIPSAWVCAGLVPSAGAAPARNTCGNADAAGRYELVGLEPGAYWLFADDAAAGAGVHGVRFPLALGEQRALDLTLTDGARVAGVVVDAAGAPVGAAYVRLMSPRTGDESRCVTDDAGRFVCAGMDGGAGYAATVYAGPDRSVPLGFVEPGPPPVIELADGDSRADGVRLAVDATRLAIRGTIVDAAGAPVADARVRG